MAKNGFSQYDVMLNCRSTQVHGKSYPIGWTATTPLGNLVGVTNSSEMLGRYNKQFSSSFAKNGLIGEQPKTKKGMKLCIILKKGRQEAKAVIVKDK